MGRKFINKVGNKYGKLTVLMFVQKTPYTKWLCACDCGNQKVIFGAHLVLGGTKSCGCINKELTSKRVKTHGKTKSKTYSSWHSMKSRCTNSNYSGYDRYGAKGISYDKSWESFENFWADMGDRPENTTLDRIDNTKGYSKENCRWATNSEQQSNRTNCLFLTFNGVTKTAKHWADELGLAPGAVWNRIKLLNWSIEKAVTTPKRG